MERNERRPDRIVDAEVIADQAERMREAVTDLKDEDYAALYVIQDAESLGRTRGRTRLVLAPRLVHAAQRDRGYGQQDEHRRDGRARRKAQKIARRIRSGRRSARRRA